MNQNRIVHIFLALTAALLLAACGDSGDNNPPIAQVDPTGTLTPAVTAPLPTLPNFPEVIELAAPATQEPTPTATEPPPPLPDFPQVIALGGMGGGGASSLESWKNYTGPLPGIEVLTDTILPNREQDPRASNIGNINICLYGIRNQGGNQIDAELSNQGREWKKSFPVEQKYPYSLFEIDLRWPLFMPEGEWTIKVNGAGKELTTQFAYHIPDTPVIEVGHSSDLDPFAVESFAFQHGQTLHLFGAGFPPNSKSYLALYRSGDPGLQFFQPVLVQSNEEGRFHQLITIDPSWEETAYQFVITPGDFSYGFDFLIDDKAASGGQAYLGGMTEFPAVPPLQEKLRYYSQQQEAINQVAFIDTGFVLLRGDGQVDYDGIPPDLAQQLKDLVSKGEKIKNVAFYKGYDEAYQPVNGWAILYGANGWLAWNVPAEVTDQLTKLHDENRTIKQVAFSGYSGQVMWTILYDSNGAVWNSIPAELAAKIQQIQSQGGEEIKRILFPPSYKAWAIVYGQEDRTVVESSWLYDDLVSQMNEIQPAAIKDISFYPDGDGWVILYGKNGWAATNVR